MGSTPVIQTSFNAGEWAPALNARVDVQKYHSGAALLRNFFVDYRGGATTRPGTRFVGPALNNGIVRLIPFQASTAVSYILEFSDGYIRPITNGASVTAPGVAITGITNANPAVITAPPGAGTWNNGATVLISGVNGMVQVNGSTYLVANASGSTFNLTDVLGNLVDSTTFGTYTGGGTVYPIVRINSPYTQNEVFGIKYTQNVNTLILCHPNHPPYELILNSAANWTLRPITFGSTAAIPTGLSSAVSGLSSGSVGYAYVVTSEDNNGQESGPSTYLNVVGYQDMRSTPGSITISWSPAANAASYNVYKAVSTYSGAVPAGSSFGFIGNATGTSLVDSNIQPDFSQGPPVPQQPFSAAGVGGGGVTNITITNRGSNYFSVPTVTVAAAPSGGTTATAVATLSAANISFAVVGGTTETGDGYYLGTVINGPNGIVLKVTGVAPILPGSENLTITSFSILNYGTVYSGGAPQSFTDSSPKFGIPGGAIFNINWWISTITVTNPGSQYTSAPAVTISGGAPAINGTATSSVSSITTTTGTGNPTVPGFFQQRLVLAGPTVNPQQFNMSQPGAYYNFDITNPIAADNAIEGTLVSGQLNQIQSMISMPPGLIMLSDRQAWLINGGGPGTPISAIQVVANSHAYNGSSAHPPIVCNYDILYVQAKQSIIRDLTYNFYTNIYTGTDISVLSSHLFYNYSIAQWAWAEEPYKLVWAVRNDGVLLTLTFVKEQEMLAWTHSDTQGSFRSVATVTEIVGAGPVDATYFVVQRQTGTYLITWDPNTAVNVTLSSGNLTVTNTGDTSGPPVGGGTTTSDESSHAHGAATFLGTATISVAQVKFGTGSLGLSTHGGLTWPTSADWNLGTTAFTIECWFYATTVSGTQAIVANWNDGDLIAAWLIRLNGSTLEWYTDNGTNNPHLDMSWAGVTANVWHHVAVDFDGTKYRLYLDGATKATSTVLRTFVANSEVVSLGCSAIGSWTLQGYIDEVRISKVARYANDTSYTVPTAAFPRGSGADPSWSSVALLDGFNNTTTGPGSNQGVMSFASAAASAGKFYFEMTYTTAVSGIQAFGVSALGTTYPVYLGSPATGDSYWANVVLLMGFEGTNGSTGSPGMTDESSKAHGTATVSGSGAAISTGDFKFGASSFSDGGAGGATFADNADWDLGSGQFTIELWVKINTTTGLHFLVDQWNLTAGTNYGWSLDLNGNIPSWRVSLTGTDNLNDLSSSVILSTGTWYHIAVDYDGSKYRMYVNGAMTASSTTARAIRNSTLPLGIGASSVGDYNLNGLIDELRITKGVARYASDSGFTVPTAAFSRSAGTPAVAPAPNGAAVFATGAIWTGGVNSGDSIGTISAGNTVAVAVDLDNRRFWAKNLSSTGVSIDPSWSNVVLLMGYEGANLSTGAPGMNDESPAAHGTGTATSSAAISTTQKVFGSSSLSLPSPGAGGTVAFPDSNDWNFGAGGAFTIEFRIYNTASTSHQMIVAQWSNSTDLAWNVALLSGSLIMEMSTTGSDFHTVVTGSAAMSLNTWYACAIDFDGTTYRAYVNGVMIGSGTTLYTPFNSSQPLTIGTNSNYSFPFYGFIDELRITKGIARYASNSGYTVATAPFPRTGSSSGPGYWNGNPVANPATNVGGEPLPAGAMIPIVAFGGPGSGNAWTADFGASAFVGTIPSGFTTWLSHPAVYNYIERLVELDYSKGYISSWQVDAGLQYVGPPASTFWGAQHLGGLTVTGLADGQIISPFPMPYNGTFTLSTPASIVTIGLAFTPQLQTLALDTGEPTIQGKRKKITAVTVRVKDALGLQIGGDAGSLTPMKDLVLGNVGTMTNGIVTGLVTGDARTIIDPNWTVPGQYFIQQSQPYPASILGVIPEITVGDTVK